MKRLLLTGFFPFGDEPINPSGEAARALHGTARGGWRVVSVVLPVGFRSAVNLLDAALRDIRPAAVLCTGQGAERFQVETVARNHVAARADNHGYTPAAGPIDPGLQDARSTLHVERLQQAVAHAVEPVPCVQSDDAGAYVCNHTLFWLLHRHSVPAGFLHVPRLSVVPQAVVTRGVAAALDAVMTA